MNYKNIVDFHIHTDNSDDGFDPVMLMCEHAVSAGLRAVAITDHCECSRYRAETYRFDKAIRQSFLEAKKAKGAFANHLIIMAGIELGQATQDFDAAYDALGANEYDFILGSMHCLKGQPDFWQVDYEKNDPFEFFDMYLDQLYELVKWNGFDSLAHLTYPLRYINGEHHFGLELSNYAEKVDEILKLLAKNEKALEINTSGYRQAYGKPLPDFDVVKKFKELGGRYITFGSDAHHATDVGKNIADGMEMAKAAGFSYFTIYEQHVPMLVPII